MDNATLEITRISATDIKNVRRFGRRMRTYASVWTDDAALKSTEIDRDGGSNPAWNQKLQVPVTRSFIRRKDSSIVIKVYCKTMVGKREVGWTKVPFSDIVDRNGNGAAPNSLKFLCYRLRTPNGKPHGAIDLSLRILGYNRPLPNPFQPKLGDDQDGAGLNPRTSWGPSFLNQSAATYGETSCAVGIPIQCLPWPPRQSWESGGNVDGYSPIPTSIYPPYPPCQQSSGR